MTHRDQDPFDLIRHGDPAPREQMPDADSPLGREVRRRALSTSRLPAPTATRRRHVLRVILAAALALAVVAAAAWLITREASDPRVVGCYETPSLDGKVVAVAEPSQIATDACEPLWEDGTLTNPSIIERFGLPPLTGCVNADGGLAVFPSDDSQLCRRLGLADHELSHPDDPTTTLNQQLLSMFAATSCLSMDTAQVQIEAMLTTDSLSGWMVSVSAAESAERPCASFSLDAPNQTVRLVPIPRPPVEQEP